VDYSVKAGLCRVEQFGRESNATVITEPGCRDDRHRPSEEVTRRTRAFVQE
jgi:hypothetical protein